MTFLRYGLPILICAVGLVWGVARNMDETGLEIMIIEYLGSLPDVYGDSGDPRLRRLG